MQLFQLHDDPNEICYNDERTYALVWADSSEEAIAYFNNHIDINRTRLNKMWEGTSWEIIDNTHGYKPEKDVVHEEQRPVLKRLLNWYEEWESSCDTCGLYPMGMEEFRVCGDCNQCTECGCDCESERE